MFIKLSISQNYQFFPAIACWIKHLQLGRFNTQDKSLFTIFGSIKRVKIVATLIEKEEFISKKVSDDNNITEDTSTNYRFILDDGTGIISAIKWINRDVSAERGQFVDLYKNLKKGDIINLIGKINSWNNRIQISIENANKLDNPNYILLNDAKIIKKVKIGPLYEIPTDLKLDDESLNAEEEFLFNAVSDDIDIDELFTNTKSPEINKLKEKVYVIIEDFSQNGNGITLNELKSKLNLTEEKLRTLIQDLVMESRIYEPEENLYQSF